MKYLAIYTPAESTAKRGPTPEHMQAMGKLIEESMKAGWLVDTGGMMPVSMGGARVRRTGDDIAVVDGPFAEAKEIVGGYAMLSAASREEMIMVVKKFLSVAGDGECKVMQIMDQGGK